MKTASENQATPRFPPLRFEIEPVAKWKRVSVVLAAAGYPALLFGFWRAFRGPVADPSFGFQGLGVALFAAASGLAMAALAWWQVRPPSTPLAVVFDDAGVQLPRRRWGRRTVRVRFDEIFSVGPFLRGPLRIVAVAPEKGWAGGFAPSWFECEETAERIERELLARIRSLPDGEARAQVIERRRAVGRASGESRMWLTWGATFLLILVYAWDLGWGQSSAPFGGHRVGAITGWLLPNGGWYRLATCQVLHLNLAHLYANLAGLWFFGLLLESVLGGWRYAVLLLGSGLGGALATAAVPLPPAVGASSMVFGVVGCLAFLNAFRRSELPAGLRLLGWGRWAAGAFLLLEFALEMLVPRVNWVGHVGGFATGLFLSWPLIAGRELARLRSSQGAWLRAAALGLTALFLAGLVRGAVLLWRGDDSWRTRLGEHLVGNVDTAPAVLDHFAWLTALDERASGPALALARRAAERAVREQSENPLHRDTLAYVYQRLGLFDAAVELQREPPARSRGCPPRGGAPTLPREGAGNQLDRIEGSRQSSPCRDLRSPRGGRSD